MWRGLYICRYPRRITVGTPRSLRLLGAENFRSGITDAPSTCSIGSPPPDTEPNRTWRLTDETPGVRRIVGKRSAGSMMAEARTG